MNITKQNWQVEKDWKGVLRCGQGISRIMQTYFMGGSTSTLTFVRDHILTVPGYYTLIRTSIGGAAASATMPAWWVAQSGLASTYVIVSASSNVNPLWVGQYAGFNYWALPYGSSVPVTVEFSDVWKGYAIWMAGASYCWLADAEPNVIYDGVFNIIASPSGWFYKVLVDDNSLCHPVVDHCDVTDATQRIGLFNTLMFVGNIATWDNHTYNYGASFKGDRWTRLNAKQPPNSGYYTLVAS